MEIRDFVVGDGPALRALWQSCGIQIRPGDDDDHLARFAAHNPGRFLLATDERGIAASALGGWDGRRGWLSHVAVRDDERRRGLGERLVRMIEDRLRVLGCAKVNLIVWEDNVSGMAFWSALGYTRERAVEFGKAL